MKPYQPKPVDTSGITLSPEIEALTEQLAENAHDLWAKQRLADGWRYGPSRDDAQIDNQEDRETRFAEWVCRCKGNC